MSLDVYLTAESAAPKSGPRIFVRRDGSTVEISREEWDRDNPGREPVVLDGADDDATVFSANITHNLNTMAEAAGIYQHLWRPDELGITLARELIAPLREGLAQLIADPTTYEKHNPPNGWGSYDGLCRFVRNYLAACEEYPDAKVSVSR